MRERSLLRRGLRARRWVLLMGRISKPAVALAITSLLLASGGGYALASSIGGTITVCVNHQGGTRYKAKKCARHPLALLKVAPEP
jgi:hypothetical protein